MRRAGIIANASVFLMFIVAHLLYVYDESLYYLSVQEDEYLEWATFWGFMIAGIIYFVHARQQFRSSRQLPWFVFGLAFFCFLVAMEEISWGQRILGYKAPDFFLSQNYQQELNLHNVINTSARKLVLQMILLGYGVILSALSIWTPVKELLERFRIVAPPPLLIASFLAMFVVYYWYPWSHTGEWVELAMAFGFTYAALIPAQLENSKDALLLTKRLVRVFATIWVLAVLTVVTLRIAQSADPDKVQNAQLEIAALRADFLSGKIEARCGLHKRLYTFMIEYEQDYLLEGEFARLLRGSGEESRAEYLLDPWNSPYWVRLKCLGDREARFVYSFGPNRSRDSSEWLLKDDDIGADLLPPTVDVVVENVSVYSGAHESPFVASIAIHDGKFLAISPPGDFKYVGTETIDASGKFITPGLWDAHAHVRSSKDRGLDIEVFAQSGVTSIRDLGGYPLRLKVVERDIADGGMQGPNIYPSYFMLNGESFTDYQRAVTSVAEVEAAIDELVALGAVQVKVHRALAPELLPHVVSLANERGLKVVGHIPLGVHPLDACQIGMDSIEHIGSFVESIVSVAPENEKNSQAAIDYLLSDAADPIYECFAEQDVTVAPTLVIYPAIAKRRAAGQEMPAEFVEFIESMQQITYRLYESRVTLLTGTDVSDLDESTTPEPGASLLEELLMLEDAGIPPAEIIAMASLNAARAIGQESKTGSIEIGKDADFLLLSADPGQSARNFRSIVSVYQMGQKVFGAPLTPLE